MREHVLTSSAFPALLPALPCPAVCLKVLAGSDASLARVWLEDCRRAFAELTSEKQHREAAEAKQEVRQEVGECGQGCVGAWQLHCCQQGQLREVWQGREWFVAWLAVMGYVVR